MFTNLKLTDMERCYKAFRREVIEGHPIEKKISWKDGLQALWCIIRYPVSD